MKTRAYVFVALAVVALAMAGCVTPQEAYIDADRATHDVIAPEYLEYVAKDGGLTEEQRDRRIRLAKSWGLRISAAMAKETAK